MPERNPFAGLGEAKKRVHKRPWPEWVSPMLATLVDEPSSGEQWIYEPKLDGVRCLAFRAGKELQLLSRNRKPLNAAYPELIEPLARQVPTSYVADGEIVAFEGGVTSFSKLQRRMQVRDPEEARRRGIKVFYYLFDLIYMDGYDLRDVPLLERKELLKRAFGFRDPLRFTEHRQGRGAAYFDEACRRGLEGIIAKDAGSAYVSKRTRSWLKIKCSAGQEFVIGGYTEPKGERVGLGALLLGYYDGGRLVYAGKVGTGFNTSDLVSLERELAPLRTGKGPFAQVSNSPKGVHWVTPKLVAQAAFTEWTRDGRLRHPRFLGIRRDKDPREVVRERPK